MDRAALKGLTKQQLIAAKAAIDAELEILSTRCSFCDQTGADPYSCRRLAGRTPGPNAEGTLRICPSCWESKRQPGQRRQHGREAAGQ